MTTTNAITTWAIAIFNLQNVPPEHITKRNNHTTTQKTNPNESMAGIQLQNI